MSLCAENNGMQDFLGLLSGTQNFLFLFLLLLVVSVTNKVPKPLHFLFAIYFLITGRERDGHNLLNLTLLMHKQANYEYNVLQSHNAIGK